MEEFAEMLYNDLKEFFERNEENILYEFNYDFNRFMEDFKTKTKPLIFIELLKEFMNQSNGKWSFREYPPCFRYPSGIRGMFALMLNKEKKEVDKK